VKEVFTNRRDAHEIIAAEQQVLMGMCRADLPPSELNGYIERLTNYSWLEPEHTTVFQAIRSVAGIPNGWWRDELRTQATRMGFPDVDWARYLSTTSPNRPMLRELVDSLVGSSPRR
jgi:hypothetical protein